MTTVANIPAQTAPNRYTAIVTCFEMVQLQASYLRVATP
jgi:hypothetical protein